MGCRLFWNEFGSAKGFIAALYGAGCRTFRIHIVWDSTHAYGSGKREEAIHEYKHCVDFMATKAGVKLYISLLCEHRLSAEVVKPLIEKAAAYSTSKGYPVPTFSNSFIDNGGQISSDKPELKIINEVHSLTPGKPGKHYIISPDGTTLDSTNALKFNATYSDALIRFAWDPTLNCHRDLSDKGRNFRPSAEHILELAKLLTNATPHRAVSMLAGNDAGILSRASQIRGVIGLEANQIYLTGFPTRIG